MKITESIIDAVTEPQHPNDPNPFDALAGLIHEINMEHGFWEANRNFGEILALIHSEMIHSEISEALEEHRSGKELVYIENGKPEGAAVELIDAVIRIFDYLDVALKETDWTIADVFNLKIKYNNGRPYKHGRAY